MLRCTVDSTLPPVKWFNGSCSQLYSADYMFVLGHLILFFLIFYTAVEGGCNTYYYNGTDHDTYQAKKKYRGQFVVSKTVIEMDSQGWK